MYVFGIHSFILISATMKLSMIQDLHSTANDLRKAADKVLTNLTSSFRPLRAWRTTLQPSMMGYVT